MATNVIGIFGKTCSAKSDVAREISRMTGNKVKHPGEMITTRARMSGLATGKDVAEKWHREVDADTVGAVEALADLERALDRSPRPAGAGTLPASSRTPATVRAGRVPVQGMPRERLGSNGRVNPARGGQGGEVRRSARRGRGGKGERQG